MKAYIFQAGLLCEFCGDKTCNHLRKSIKSLHPDFDEADESTFDSDYFPKGPYADGGGEADRPQHCDHCCTFLKNPLTYEGVLHVNTLAIPYMDKEELPWSEIANRADAEKPVLAEWIRYYFTWGR